MKILLIRDVTMKECRWLRRDFKKGELIYKYLWNTYGCIGRNGIACSLDGNIPFFELPKDAVIIINEN